MYVLGTAIIGGKSKGGSAYINELIVPSVTVRSKTNSINILVILQ